MKKPPPMKKIPKERSSGNKNEAKAIVSSEETFDPRPQFSISEVYYPEIKNWSAGKKYPLMIEVEMVGSRIEDWGPDKGKYTGSFKINGIGSHMEEEEEEEFPKGMKVKK
jgi:hypothetical protein